MSPEIINRLLVLQIITYSKDSDETNNVEDYYYYYSNYDQICHYRLSNIHSLYQS